MTAAKYRRYPVAPLLHCLEGLSNRQVHARFKIHWTTIQRWRTKPDTLIIEWDADKYAVMMGKHPSEVWDDWFDVNAPIAPWRKLKVNA
jgi:hypothetical protein